MYAAAGEGSWNPEEHIHLFMDDTLIPYDVSSSKMVSQTNQKIFMLHPYTTYLHGKIIGHVADICPLAPTIPLLSLRIRHGRKETLHLGPVPRHRQRRP